ncbi:Putative gluconokinase [Heterocephalus glaber]|uniref:gluconokinase n=1 Tax=Heterocephalus glaber TaxID=10181 RepID=G5BP05_HETGA|nr:Putative gluconokinase [Heterocephalus glaber]
MAVLSALLVMGVSGAGKSTVGAVLASECLDEDPEPQGRSGPYSGGGGSPQHNLEATGCAKDQLGVHDYYEDFHFWNLLKIAILNSKNFEAAKEKALKVLEQVKDRSPWLCNLHDILLRDIASGQHVVLACSALKKMHRDILIRGKDTAPPKFRESKEEKLAKVQLLVVHLSGSFEVISGRLHQRKGHFMPPELLQSQFDTLEPPTAPENFIQISVDKKLSEIITIVLETLKMK